MSDLYKIVGVEKSASTQAIKKAYRKKAKTMHPDHGGKKEKWGELQKAHDILVDAERRSKYDATGDTTEKTPDNAYAQAINIVAHAFNTVLQECANSGQSPLETDIIRFVNGKISTGIQEAHKQIRILKNMLETDKKLQGRFKAKKENIFEGIVANRIMSMEINIRNLEDIIKNSNAGLELIKDSTFRMDPKQQRENNIGNFVFNLGAM